MSAVHDSLDILRLLGLALLHFLWQGGVVGAAYLLARSTLPRGAARYWLGVAALAMLTLCPVVTLWWLSQEPATAGSSMVIQPEPGVLGTTGLLAAPQGEGVAWLAGVLPWLTVFWFAGVLLLAFRAWRQWRRLRLMIKSAQPVDGRVLRTLLSLIERFGLRQGISLRWSSVIDAPVLVGVIRPVILLPWAMASGFPAAQLELVLAHELAHMKRLDPWVNLWQIALETLFFYHPVVHWISRDVRNEREICCDELALAVHGGNWRDLAKALSRLGDLREQSAPMSLAANGGVLLDRVQQMAVSQGAMQVQPAPRLHTGVLMAGGVLATLIIGLVWNRETAPDVLAPVPVVPAAVVSLAQSGLQGWQLADLKPLGFSAARPVMAKAEAPEDEAMPSITPMIGMESMSARRAGLLTVADLAPAQGISPTPHVAMPAAETAALAPTPTQIREPVYPATALEKGIEGKVVIEFSLAANGSVQNLRVVGAEPAGVFDQAALDAMRGWTYAVPRGDLASERYRQVMAFTLDAKQRANTREIRATAGCQTVTGSLICRSREDLVRMDSQGDTMAGVQEH